MCAKSVVDAFAHDMLSNLFGNPHSASSSSQLSSSRIDDTRLRLLSFFNADPKEWDVVFTANATAGVKLVVDAMRALPQGYSFIHHQSCHTSVIGAREDAVHSVCINDLDLDRLIAGESLLDGADMTSATLFAYSAQSHMTGRRYPLSWTKHHETHEDRHLPPLYTLLDAASFCASSPLNLGSADFAADFVALSLYKIFGFPDLGALLVRRSAERVFDNRRYFGGGTVDLVICGREEQWHARKAQFLHERLEDGTLPFHNIIALDSALTIHTKLFGSMECINAHVASLTQCLFTGLQKLQHHNSRPVCVLYSHSPVTADPSGAGPVVSFNLRTSAGGWVRLEEFEKLAELRNIHIRTGGLCSPGDMAAVLELEPSELRRNLSAGFRCGTGNGSSSGKPTGVIRASLGAMSTERDVTRFIEFVREFFVENDPVLSARNAPKGPMPTLRVQAITVFPIKSCGGFTVSPGTRWEVKPEGLSWDREWCLIHRGSGQVLSQKRYPKMALLRPVLDFDKSILRVSFAGPMEEKQQDSPSVIHVPLSADSSLLDQRSQGTPFRVCGESVFAQAYISREINSFFSTVLGVPCVLARFPPGGGGLYSRTTKARVQSYQRAWTQRTLPGTFPGVPSPPESDNEQAGGNKILLSNESPLLLVSRSSVDALNEEIARKGRGTVPYGTFRANIVVGSQSDGHYSPNDAYAEDTWSRIRIGSHNFKLLGACQRCQMVCIDQVTGQRRQEPFSTLATARRFDGKVYFGAHMRLESPRGHDMSTEQTPSIQIGDLVAVEEWISEDAQH